MPREHSCYFLVKPVKLVRVLATSVSEVIAMSASKVVAARWEVEFPHSAVTRFSVNNEGTSKPVTNTAKMGLCSLNGYFAEIVSLILRLT